MRRDEWSFVSFHEENLERKREKKERKRKERKRKEIKGRKRERRPTAKERERGLQQQPGGRRKRWSRHRPLPEPLSIAVVAMMTFFNGKSPDRDFRIDFNFDLKNCF